MFFCVLTGIVSDLITTRFTSNSFISLIYVIINANLIFLLVFIISGRFVSFFFGGLINLIVIIYGGLIYFFCVGFIFMYVVMVVLLYCNVSINYRDSTTMIHYYDVNLLVLRHFQIFSVFIH